MAPIYFLFYIVYESSSIIYYNDRYNKEFVII